MLNNRFSYYLLSITIVFSCFSNQTWGQQSEKFKSDVKLAVSYLKQNKAVEADSIFSSLDDKNAILLDSIEWGYYYFKGLAKFSIDNYKAAIPYFEKSKTITDSLKIFDFDYLDLNNCLSHCYYYQKEYDKAESCLRWLIVKHNDLLETYPNKAAYSYHILANLYEELGDTILSEFIHYYNKQYYLIKSYQLEHPNDPIGQETLDSYNLIKTVMYNGFEGSVDSIYIDCLWMMGKYMEKIDEDYEAMWCYDNCIRCANDYIGKYKSTQKPAYLNLLNLYATNKLFGDFNSFLPNAIDYIKNVENNDDIDNEFALGLLYGNIFLEQGDFEEAYNCYKISKRYLEAENLIPNQHNKVIQLYLSISIVCNSLKLYEESLAYCDSIENIIDSGDSSYQHDLFKTRLRRSEAYIYMNNFNAADELLDSLKQQAITMSGVYSMDYIEVSLNKASNYFRQHRDSDVINELLPIIECSDYYSESWGPFWYPAYFLLASAYMCTLDYMSALKTLEALADLEKNKNGKVSKMTKEYINECKSKL